MNVSLNRTRDYATIAAAISERVERNERVRRRVPDGGCVHIDRQLPFLCVARFGEPSPEATASFGPLMPGRQDQPCALDATASLVTAEASFATGPATGPAAAAFRQLCTDVLGTLSKLFGACLLAEVWAGPVEAAAPQRLPVLRFRLSHNGAEGAAESLAAAGRALEEIRIAGYQVEVDEAPAGELRPPDLPPLIDESTASRLGCATIGIQVAPVYQHPSTRRPYPVLLDQLREQLSRALRHAFCAFAGLHVTGAPRHSDELGRRELQRAVGEADQLLCQVAETLDFLLLVTPINGQDAWRQFTDHRWQREPVLLYRPLPFQPDLVKRALYQVPLERVEDPVLARLLTEKQHELDRKITMLRDRGTRQFYYGSLQLHGGAEPWLIDLARQVLATPPAKGPQEPEEEMVSGEQFAAAARREILYYRRLDPQFHAKVELLDDLASGVLVSQDRLLVARSLRLPRSRVEPLVHHEVGTHLLTYFNGRAQPLKQLATGLAHYEPLQEGLAVLAEYLSGNLPRSRLRVLAARVLAVDCLCRGASFIETFRGLHDQWQLAPRVAFHTTLRAFRGGGYTKDASYLRGLAQVVRYLQQGLELWPLYAGKMALGQLETVRQLKRRGIIQPPLVQPRYLRGPLARRQLQRIRQGTLEQWFDELLLS